MSLTYVYCLVRADRRPSLRHAPPGMPGSGGLLVLDADDACWAIASHVPDSEYDEAALAAGLSRLDWVAERAMAHQAVVERFLGARAVLPMPLFTLFTSDERAVRSLTRDRRRLDRILLRIERQLEWGVRVMLDEQAIRRRPPAVAGRRQTPPAESGVAYLARKRRARADHRERLVQARAEGNRLYRELAREASAAVKHPPAASEAPSRLVVDAAFLVPVARTSAFRSAVRRHARALDRGLVVSLTGPWPPYNFVRSRSRGAGA